MMSWPDNVGILALEVYIPKTYVAHEELEVFDGVSTGKLLLHLIAMWDVKGFKGADSQSLDKQ